LGPRKVTSSRKPVEKAPKTQNLPERFQDWMQEHSTKIVAGLVVVLLILAASWGISYYRSSKEDRARVEYAALVDKWPAEEGIDQKEWEVLTAGLEKFANSHRGTAAAINAKLDLSKAYYRMGRYDDALKWGMVVLSDVPSGHSLMPLIRYQLALTNQTMGRVDEALAQWEALRDVNITSLQREVHWQLARIYSMKQEHAKAIEQYKAALNTSGAYPSEVLLREELSSIESLAASQGGVPAETAPTAKP
jgi:predicted negative regulator of RcsB-dependent stress response